MGEKVLINTNLVFNSPIEIGLRAICILFEGYPNSFSLQQLIYLDYITIHSDDIPDGPKGLHPKTPQRSGEILVRRESLEQGLFLYMSRGLLNRLFTENGICYIASEDTASFLDTLKSKYILSLRERANWAVLAFDDMTEDTLGIYINQNLGIWGAEFEQESILYRS